MCHNMICKKKIIVGNYYIHGVRQIAMYNVGQFNHGNILLDDHIMPVLYEYGYLNIWREQMEMRESLNTSDIATNVTEIDGQADRYCNEDTETLFGQCCDSQSINMESSKILVCGAREYDSQHVVSHYIQQLISTMNIKNIVIISGGCKGVDTLAETFARTNNHQCQIFLPDWKRYGRAAGPIRNRQMIDEGHPDGVLAFHDCIEKAKGTKDMINKAVAHMIPVILVENNGQTFRNITSRLK